VKTAALNRGQIKDALGRVTPPDHPFAHEREIYLHVEQRPKWATGSAWGFDPQHQLLRWVAVDPFKGHIWLDWVFGVDTPGELIIADLPGKTMSNAVRRVFRRPLLTRPAIAFKDRSSKIQELAGVPLPHLALARRLVREMNFHRPKEKTLTL
jgi:hypothetical protein